MNDFMNCGKLDKYVGCVDQLFGAKSYVFADGKARGVRAVDVDNGAGLTFTVLLDRGMDIMKLAWRGMNCSYLSPVGVVAPQYYEKDGDHFLRTYTAGFLTTCGLTQVGVPNVDEGEELGLHGRISHIPAENIFAGARRTANGHEIVVSGSMRQAKFFGENLTLERELKCVPGQNRLEIQDVVRNLGHRTEPLMILYHINIGYPLLDEHAQVFASSDEVLPHNDASELDMDWVHCHAPQKDFAEKVYLHKGMRTDAAGKSYIGIVNDKLKKGVVVLFDGKQLDQLIQWKQLGEGAYVVGLEPSNCGGYGRHEARKRGVLKTIKPGESQQFSLNIEMLDDVGSGTDFNKLFEEA